MGNKEQKKSGGKKKAFNGSFRTCIITLGIQSFMSSCFLGAQVSSLKNEHEDEGKENENEKKKQEIPLSMLFYDFPHVFYALKMFLILNPHASLAMDKNLYRHPEKWGQKYVLIYPAHPVPGYENKNITLYE